MYKLKETVKSLGPRAYLSVYYERQALESLLEGKIKLELYNLLQFFKNIFWLF